MSISIKNMALCFCLYICTHSQISHAKIDDVIKAVAHHTVNNSGVNIHYVSIGEGPLLLFVHGFPDFWYGWREQIVEFAKDYHVVAVDLRGYNLSDKPKGSKNYTYDFLIQDIKSVIEDVGREPAHIIAHDWGAGISWRFAAHYPELVNKLIILSIAHPKAGKGIKDLKKINNLEEVKLTYADYFVSQEFIKKLTENWFSGWVLGEKHKSIYKQAFRNSDKLAMINYYKANFPTNNNLNDQDYINKFNQPLPHIQSPVLVVHGKNDAYASTESHHHSWEFIDNEYRFVLLPNTGHFIQRDESEKLNELIRSFLKPKF